MASHETRFQANLAKKRRWSYLTVLISLVVGFFRDSSNGIKFPGPGTIISSILVFVVFELHSYLRGVRALSISSNGITLERWFGKKVLRLTWSELHSVEFRRTPTGPIWTFCTKAGARVRWVQIGFDGDKRIELERTLTGVLREHGIRLR